MTSFRQIQPSLVMYVCHLQAVPSLAECGGKAFNLKRMLDRQLPVPSGIVVTNRAFQIFLDQNKLRSLIETHRQTIDLKHPESCQTASSAIQYAVFQGTIPQVVIDAIAEQLSNLPPDGKLVVRSSAVGEDSEHAAFAGQLDSILHVERDLEAICQALKACWASYWSARVLFYQRSRGASLDGMGVVIQEQVAGSLSGVLFTRQPTSPTAVEIADENPLTLAPLALSPHSRSEGIRDIQRVNDTVIRNPSFDADENPLTLALSPQSRGEGMMASADSMLVEFCEGLGDQLVAGRITPGRILLARGISTWSLEAWPEETHANDRIAAICDQHMPRLASFGLELETAFGSPQDIEWTISTDGRLFLLQSRPITVCSGPDAPATVVWSNANVNENYPDPICPLLYSIASLGYYHYFRNLGLAFGISHRRIEAMESPLRNLVGVHSARLYYHLTNIHAVLRMAPGGEMLTDAFNLFVGSDRTERTNPGLTWSGYARGWLGQACEIVNIAFMTSLTFLRLSSRVTRFERTVDEFAARTQPQSLAARSLPELLNDLRGFLTIRCHRWVDASIADAAAMFSYSLLKRFLNREFPSSDESTLHNSLLKGLRDVVSGTPLLELWNLSRQIRADAALHALFTTERDSRTEHDSRTTGPSVSNAEVLREVRRNPRFESFRAALDRFLECWGFRCSGELMLTVPSFQERPEALVDILRSYAELDGESPTERLDRQNVERVDTTRQVLDQLGKRWLFKRFPWPRKSFVARRLLAWTQHAILFRERARLKQALLYSRCRRIALAIGGQLAREQIVNRAEDAFFLTIQELESLLDGSSMFPRQVRELVALRRAAQEEFSRDRPPDTFSLPFGAYWTPGSPSRSLKAQAPAPEPQADVLKGLGVCGGLAISRAAVLNDVTEQGQLSPGDILVTRQTDPGWGPVFLLIQGLVMERGGMLSHGAILAREYGLPTVVGITDATRRIRPGQTITVNGDCGHVELL